MMRVEILLRSEARNKRPWDHLSSGLGGIAPGKKKKSRQDVRVVRIILSRNIYTVNRRTPVAVSKSHSSSLGTGSWWCCILRHRSEALVWFTRVPSWLQINIVYVAISVRSRNFKAAEQESVCLETAKDERAFLAIGCSHRLIEGPIAEEKHNTIQKTRRSWASAWLEPSPLCSSVRGTERYSACYQRER